MLFILGSPNSPTGELSAISRSRIDLAVSLQTADADLVLLATGGFGEHFNTSTASHREWVHAELSRLGARLDAAEPHDLLSSNTVEDVLLIMDFVKAREVDTYQVATSSFHVERCRFIFDCLAPKHRVTLHSAADPDDLPPRLSSHEKRALDQLRRQKGVLVNGQLFQPTGEAPSTSPQRPVQSGAVG